MESGALIWLQKNFKENQTRKSEFVLSPKHPVQLLRLKQVAGTLFMSMNIMQKLVGFCIILTPAATEAGQKLTSDQTLHPKLKSCKSTRAPEILCCAGVPQSHGLALEKL